MRAEESRVKRGSSHSAASNQTPSSRNAYTRRDLVAKREASIAKLIAEAPPLTPGQRDRLNMIFRASRGGSA